MISRPGSAEKCGLLAGPDLGPPEHPVRFLESRSGNQLYRPRWSVFRTTDEPRRFLSGKPLMT